MSDPTSSAVHVNAHTAVPQYTALSTGYEMKSCGEVVKSVTFPVKPGDKHVITPATIAKLFPKSSLPSTDHIYTGVEAISLSPATHNRSTLQLDLDFHVGGQKVDVADHAHLTGTNEAGGVDMGTNQIVSQHAMKVPNTPYLDGHPVNYARVPLNVTTSENEDAKRAEIKHHVQWKNTTLDQMQNGIVEVKGSRLTNGTDDGECPKSYYVPTDIPTDGQNGAPLVWKEHPMHSQILTKWQRHNGIKLPTVDMPYVGTTHMVKHVCVPGQDYDKITKELQDQVFTRQTTQLPIKVTTTAVGDALPNARSSTLTLNLHQGVMQLRPRSHGR